MNSPFSDFLEVATENLNNNFQAAGELEVKGPFINSREIVFHSEFPEPATENWTVPSGPINIDGYEDPNNSGLWLAKINASQTLSKNFTAGEFARAEEGKYKWEYYRVDLDLINQLQILRDILGRPVIIIDGYYPPKHYLNVYGKTLPLNNPHFSGRGAKIRVSGMSGKKIAEKILTHCDQGLSVTFGETTAAIYIKHNGPRISSYIKDTKRRDEAIRYLEEVDRNVKSGATPVTPVLPQTPSRWHDIFKDARPCMAIPLLHGKQAFPKMVEAIRSANGADNYIYILGWMLQVDFQMIPGDPSSTLENLLQEAANKDVEIRVLIWNNPLNVVSIDKSYITINNLRNRNKNGVKANATMYKDDATFGAPYLQSKLQGLKYFISLIPSQFDVFKKWKNLKLKINAPQNEGSHHEKVLIVKGQTGLTAFCGGIDINENRITGYDESKVLHDVHCQVYNDAAWVLLHRFIWRWEKYHLYKGLSIPKLKGDEDNVRPTTPAIPIPNKAYVKIVQTYNLPSSAQVKDRSIREAVRLAIYHAREKIHLEDQYMISLEIADWLNKKLFEPGFKSLTILTQDDSIAGEDIQFPKDMRRKFQEHLYIGLNDAQKNKVSIEQLTLAFPANSHHMVHSKIYIIDDDLAIVGSANCSSRSMTHDSETAAVIFNDPGDESFFAKILTTKLDTDPLKRTRKYDPNPDFKDLDVELTEQIDSLVSSPRSISDAIWGGLSSAAGLSNQLLVAKQLIPGIKPFVIDIIDPDADNTNPQQEIQDEFLNSLEAINETSLNESQLLSPGILKLSPRTASFLPPEKNAEARKYNVSQVQKSGITLTNILNALGNHFDLGIIEAALTDMNNNSTGTKFNISTAPGTVVDAVFTEAIHQFQISNYVDPRDQDAVLGQSTLETLGFFEHKLRSKAGYLSTYGDVLKSINSSIGTATGNEFNSTNWYNYILQPAWLGIKLTTGVHVLLYRKLKEAQDWLLTQPQYQGLTAAALGQKLGISRVTGSRSLQQDQAMHAYGLAIDIDSDKNPWIGAGWIKYDKVKLIERTRMLDVLKKASGQNLSGSTIFSYLDSIAQTNGTDTTVAYSTLKQRNDEFVDYVNQHPSELSFWRSSATFGNGVAANGFLHLHPDLVYALRQIAGLAWGAIDFGPRASGDIMHFDLRTIGAGKILCEKIGGFVPKTGHPSITHETISDEIESEQLYDHESPAESELHEAIEEAEWTDQEGESIYHEAIEETIPEQEDLFSTGLPSQSSLGKLTVDTSIGVLAKSYPEYSFTLDDAIWLARFVEGEAGGRDNSDSHAVIWAMFNRFGILRHRVPSWTSLSVFLRKYSTTLQPLLNSAGAAERVWANYNINNSKYDVVSSEEKYPGTNIKKVQYVRHIKLQQKPWNDFAPYVRNMVVKILTGQIPNPGIGVATDFDSTYVFMMAARRKRGITSEPSHEEWREYTLRHALAKKMIWIGERTNLNQLKNAFYIKSYLKDVPADAVKVIWLHQPELSDQEIMGMEKEEEEEDLVTDELNVELKHEIFGLSPKTPEFENYSLVQRIDMVRIWKDLLLYKVPDKIVDRLRVRNMHVQYAHNESWSNDLNIDFYSLRIKRYPTLGGALTDAQSLIKYIRIHINELVDTSYCDFNPYSPGDAAIWNSDNPLGAVMKLDIKGPDNASVVVSWAGRKGWQFSTIYAPDTGKHPVSGHREFYIISAPSGGGDPFFAIKGLDMMSTGVAGLGLPIFGEWGFGQADALWKSMRSRIIRFINSNGGQAIEDQTYSERVEWRYVYRDYKKLLEDVFGKGAGSAENSSFFNFQTESAEI